MPKNVLWGGNIGATRASSDLQTKLISLNIPVTTMLPGQNLDLGSGADLKVLSTSPRGAVLLLEWENFRTLLPMGMDISSLESLQYRSTMRNISALLLPESGFAPLTPPELLHDLNPQLALISVSAGDKSGLPSPETLASLQEYNVQRTDQNGWIEISTDGKRMWVETAR
jgi:hypothetical protein